VDAFRPCAHDRQATFRPLLATFARIALFPAFSGLASGAAFSNLALLALFAALSGRPRKPVSATFAGRPLFATLALRSNLALLALFAALAILTVTAIPDLGKPAIETPLQFGQPQFALCVHTLDVGNRGCNAQAALALNTAGNRAKLASEKIKRRRRGWHVMS
jgi:hypothetical protein